MAATPPHPVLPRKGMAPRPPRIIINNTAPYGSASRTPQMPFTAGTVPPFTSGTVPPFTAATNATMPNSMGGPPVWPPYATSYFTKGFEGFRDFAKIGLSSGEKSAFWLYSKVSGLSRRWFTHIFLFTVVLMYSCIGALIFQAVEGPTEKRQMENIRSQRNELLAKLRMLSLDNEMLRDADRWEGRALAYIREYKHVLQDSFREEPPKLKWSFWNTMFYCGTIYTTIVSSNPKYSESDAPNDKLLIDDGYSVGTWTQILSKTEEEDWKSQARLKLRKFEEELHSAHESGMTSYSGTKSWSFVNSLIYCWTVVTTIGYGHISPTTVVGQAVTIVYSIIGIPMFLILLADFGKLFTRGIKFWWVFVRRLYYTGTVRKIRKHQQIQQMMQGMNIVYEIAMRRPTLANLGFVDPEKGEGEMAKPPETPQSQPEHHGSTADTPTSPAPETFLIDDEFNLPISVAIAILLLYIFLGAAVYCLWEDWTYFESIYFVFISMSTVGFGDFVPQHPIFMMCSIAYLIFGLALTSMCINVVQVKLSNSFKQASAKIGATIGFEMSDEEAMSTQNQTPMEMSSIPPSPKFERSSMFALSREQSLRNFCTDSPPPIPRRSPIKFDEKENEKEKEKDKTKNKKSKK